MKLRTSLPVSQAGTALGGNASGAALGAVMNGRTVAASSVTEDTFSAKFDSELS